MHKFSGTGDTVQGLTASMRSDDAPLRDERMRPQRVKYAAVLQLIGAGVGALLGAVVGVLLATSPLTKHGGTNTLEKSAAWVILFGICGVFWGPALALLIMPGRHRVLILMALATGMALGGAFGLSVYRCAVITLLNSFSVGIGVSVGVSLGACLFSKEMEGIE